MKFSLNTLVLYLSTLTLSGCVSIGMKSLDAVDLKKMKSVAVISLIDSPIAYPYIGTTVFQNKEQALDISKWNIKDFIEQSMVKKLRASGYFARVGILSKSIPASNLLGKDGAAIMISAAKAEGYDSVLAIEPMADGTNFPIQTGIRLGVASQFGIKRSNLSLLASVRIYNTGTQELFAWRRAFDNIGGNPAATSPDSVPWKASAMELTASDLEQIQKVLKAQIERELNYAMEVLGLVKESK